jgi:hypothetical protein
VPSVYRKTEKPMTSRIVLRLAEILVPLILAITIFVSWQADRRDRAQLATQLAAAQQTIAQATVNQHDRDAALNQTLTQVAAQKQSAVTPAQILKALPNAIPLPQPLALRTDPSQSAQPTNQSTNPADRSPGKPDNPTPKAGWPLDAVLPAADLKPLYDFALDCKACQAKLAASQSDLTDEKTKTAALTKERDAAVRAAKGGSALRRIARAAKWFAIGAAAGAVAAKVTH